MRLLVAHPRAATAATARAEREVLQEVPARAGLLPAATPLAEVLLHEVFRPAEAVRAAVAVAVVQVDGTKKKITLVGNSKSMFIFGK